MSSKENAAINQLFERLECRYALRVLWALKDGHPQTFRLLQDSVGGITPTVSFRQTPSAAARRSLIRTPRCRRRSRRCAPARAWHPRWDEADHRAG